MVLTIDKADESASWDGHGVRDPRPAKPALYCTFEAIEGGDPDIHEMWVYCGKTDDEIEMAGMAERHNETWPGHLGAMAILTTSGRVHHHIFKRQEGDGRDSDV